MSQKLKKTILLVDYENIQNINLSVIQEQEIEIKIFVGQAQNKVPIELVQATQKFGSRVEWIKIEGTGSNALDFHIAFYLGRFSKDIGGGSFLILSKDKGFDPLIKYINKSKVNCQRIQSLLELSKEKDALISQNTDSITKAIENLSKIQKNKRPRTRKTLRQHIKSLLIQKKLSDQEIDTLVDTLFVQKKISEASNHLTYNF
ncbi:PIN domain-containing protein [Leptolyngbya sp. AN02str]|uniref:PIN domain-containing protein n=1 Tax=Leptolyngbya sp. AN02str TaxID=3423363 RepID=UPI003D323303